MFRLLLLAGIIYLLFKLLFRAVPATPKTGPNGKTGGQIEEMFQDPACGTWVPLSQAIILDQGDERHYFCSSECRDKYLKETNN